MRHRDHPFAAYLGTQASWFFAFGLQSVLVPFIARRLLDASEAGVGLAQASLTAPVALLILFGGVAAERFDRRVLLVGLHVLAALPPLFLSWAAATGNLSMMWLITYGLALGTVGAIMLPTRDAALNAAAEASHGEISIQQAVVLASLIQFSGQIAGMGVASVAQFLVAAYAPDLGALTPAGLMVIQSIVLALGAASALALPRLAPPGPRNAKGVGSQVAEGLRIVWTSPVIRPLAISMVAIGVFVIGGAFLVLLPLLVLDAFGGGLGSLGLTLMTFWLGGAVATLVLARFGHVERQGRVLILALTLGALSMAAFATEPPFWVVITLVFFWGASGGVGIAMSRSIVQTAAPPDALARVLSIYQLGFMGGAPIGAVAMGAVVQAFGDRAGAFLAMTGVLAAAAWLTWATPIGKLRGHAIAD